MTTAATKHRDKPKPARTPNVNIKTSIEFAYELITKPAVARMLPAMDTLRQPYLSVRKLATGPDNSGIAMNRLPIQAVFDLPSPK